MYLFSMASYCFVSLFELVGQNCIAFHAGESTHRRVDWKMERNGQYSEGMYLFLFIF